jgi:GAF domain-containing protein
MVEVTQALAERIAEVARLLDDDDDSEPGLHRLTSLGVALVPGATAAAVTVTAGGQGHTFAASQASVEELHRMQFDWSHGPVVEALQYTEARHIRDTSTEHRWPAFCRAAADAGFGSCLVLPLHSSQPPPGVIALYADSPGAFGGVAHDIALLFAAQGGTAVHNAEIYEQCCRMVSNLKTAVESRAVIEQAKGIVHARLGISPDEAFHLISRTSQDTNEKVRVIAGKLVRDEIDASDLGGR